MASAATLHRRGPWLLVGTSLAAVGVLLLLLRPPSTSSNDRDGAPLVVYCAAGLIKPVEEIAAEYQEKFGVQISIEPGGTGALLAKIEAAPDAGDLFLAADAEDIRRLRRREQPRVLEVIPVARQTAVIATSPAAKDRVKSLDDLTRSDVKVVLANPSAAIGKFITDQLTKSGHWPQLTQRMKAASAEVSFVGTVNEVAQALQLGVADAGMVWDATARQFDLPMVRVSALEALPQEVQIGVLSSARNPTAALRFARYLTSRDRGMPHFTAHHYSPTPDADQWAETPRLQLMSGAMLRPGIESTLAAFAQREGIEYDVAYNGCGILVTQMRAGAAPDAYFSCDVSFMDNVQDLFDRPATLSENEMVILAPKGKSAEIRGLDDLLRPGVRVGLGHREQSALGALTFRLLERLGKLEALEASGNIKVETPTGDLLVNQVVTGALDAVIVYRSNAVANPENLEKFVDLVPLSVPGAMAVQPIAAGRNSQHKHLVNRLLDALRSDSARERMESVGFRFRGERP